MRDDVAQRVDPARLDHTVLPNPKNFALVNHLARNHFAFAFAKSLR